MDKKKLSVLKLQDKYYTKPTLASSIYLKTKDILSLDKEFIFLEPSAGNGSFIKEFKEEFIAFDLYPENEKIIKQDFLKINILDYIQPNKKIITIGNPPFGNRAKLAIDFLNKSLEFSEYVCFILPIQFKKWSVQSKINKNANLIYEEDLEENSFLLNEKDYKIRCCFQIWTKKNSSINLRIKSKPSIEHKDFKIFQYNRTCESEKYFEYDWDFAVPRQGFYNYSPIFNKNLLDKKIQYMFFKANNKETLLNLLKIDFNKLSRKNTLIHGFGKADLITEYNSLYVEESVNEF